HTYAIRIDDGALLDAAEQIDQARAHLTEPGQRQIAGILGCEPERLDRELDTLGARAKSRGLKLRITREVRDPAPNRRSPYGHAPDRARYPFSPAGGGDSAAGIWVIAPAFMIALAHQQLQDDESGRAGEGAYFAGARWDDAEPHDAGAEDGGPRAAVGARHAE